ncbi:MAG: type II secretion system protein [Bacilli bacterium]|nr:type II secretion system protein [Bacilli bacterium]
MRKKNGFTLVELLAVIVVLAIIMIIAIPSVLDTMNNARRKSFVLEAQKVFKSTQEQYTMDSQSSIPGAGVYIYNIKTDLGTADTGNYLGFVIVDATNVDDPQYTIYLWDNNYMLFRYNVNASGGFPDPTDANTIQGFNAATVASFNSEYPACNDYLGDTRVSAGEFCMNRHGLQFTA